MWRLFRCFLPFLFSHFTKLLGFRALSISVTSQATWFKMSIPKHQHHWWFSSVWYLVCQLLGHSVSELHQIFLIWPGHVRVYELPRYFFLGPQWLSVSSSVTWFTELIITSSLLSCGQWLMPSALKTIVSCMLSNFFVVSDRMVNLAPAISSWSEENV